MTTDVNSALRVGSPLTYIVLTFALSIPFWIAGALTNINCCPGIPISAFGIICPVGAAAILVYRENGHAGVLALLKRSFDFKRVEGELWYVPSILLMPCIMVLSYVVMRLMGVPMPAPQFSFATTLILFVVFFIAAIGEELGWSGYAIDPLQERFGALGGALLLGAVWAVWHVIPLLSVQRSLVWLAWWSLGTVAIAGHHRVALQQHRRECLRRRPLPRHDQPYVAALSGQRFILRSARDGRDHRSGGRSRGHRMGATHVGSRARRPWVDRRDGSCSCDSSGGAAMRPFETLLALANLLIFFVVALPRLRVVVWTALYGADRAADSRCAGAGGGASAGRWFPHTR